MCIYITPPLFEKKRIIVCKIFFLGSLQAWWVVFDCVEDVKFRQSGLFGRLCLNKARLGAGAEPVLGSIERIQQLWRQVLELGQSVRGADEMYVRRRSHLRIGFG